VQFSFPVITGTLAFSLGKKASEYATHRWTVYLRSPTGEDLTHILKKASHFIFKDVQPPPPLFFLHTGPTFTLYFSHVGDF
jgi:YEATS domain-containing protein 4